jgi:hypothetical protein
MGRTCSGSISVDRVGIEPRKRLAQLLGALGGASRFSAQRTAVPEDLTIEISGIGPSAVAHLTGAILNPSGGRQNPSGG